MFFLWYFKLFYFCFSTEEVQKPQIKTEHTSNPDKAVYLECLYNGTIIWNCTNRETPTPTSPNNQKIGQSIVFERTWVPDACCTCTLKNDVSEKTSDQMCEKDIFPGKTLSVTLTSS